MPINKPLSDQDLFIIESMVTSNQIGTHWEDCYKTHKHCAILRLVREVRKQRSMLQKCWHSVNGHGAFPDEEVMEVLGDE
jgi:hypothetical protein